MAEQSRRTFLRQVSAGGAVAGAAALVPALLGGADGTASAKPARTAPHAGPARRAAHRFAAPGVRYEVRVNMPAATVDQLASTGHRLLMFKAVQSEQSAGGLPVLWSSTSTYRTRTELAWTEQYYAFVTPGETPEGARLAGVGLTRVAPGQTLDVGPGVRSTVIGGGTPGAVTISDTTATPLSCGLAQPAPVGGAPVPVCALPLAGQGQTVVLPVGQVVLAFATGSPAPGSVVKTAPGPAVQVDLDRMSPADLSYDVESGWSWDGDFAAAVPGGGFVAALVHPAPGVRLGGGTGSGTPVSGITLRAVREPGAVAGASAGASADASADGEGAAQGVAAGPPAAVASTGTETRTTITCSLDPDSHVALHGRYLVEYRRARSGGQRALVRCTSVAAARGGAYTFKKLRQEGTDGR
ncbi:twin-arginine translocation signal domain-containing protein [Streptomyces sp. SID10853]|uniref:twin-arginine translocation signal domain-containing protein n=1 Tax=Streptomyces sp. SID10853 TaxID=2706028 RepID=UPI0013BFC198|nr:twin-arginine translocation signal domain-containing protein [Streptomyces sp. SID10853]NDZ81461.1 twin-arginine translocation signal domain-containing protein [Streptomyces sp. SID10853]